ncbi:taxadiene 5-alpha hydroxylase [Gossypium australe]|uniref:Taxadiene 5-alpha hydroxylase n=1 Tax=Gossypium australe TaxID=47621 RepID=A0A5B6WZI4_9ROSI|nr:taxadiene 5-alpha hydroxylase [Gossypium australe]
MLRCYILEFEDSWEKFILLSSIKTTPYKALFGQKCITPLYWTKLSDRKISSTDLIRETEDKVKII